MWTLKHWMLVSYLLLLEHIYKKLNCLGFPCVHGQFPCVFQYINNKYYFYKRPPPGLTAIPVCKCTLGSQKWKRLFLFFYFTASCVTFSKWGTFAFTFIFIVALLFRFMVLLCLFWNTSLTLMIVTLVFSLERFVTVHTQNTVLFMLDMHFFMLEEARLADIYFKAIRYITHIPMGWMLRTNMSHKGMFITAPHFTNWTRYLSWQQHWTTCSFLIYTGNWRWSWTIMCSIMDLLFDDRQVKFSPVSSQITDRFKDDMTDFTFQETTLSTWSRWWSRSMQFRDSYLGILTFQKNCNV